MGGSVPTNSTTLSPLRLEAWRLGIFRVGAIVARVKARARARAHRTTIPRNLGLRATPNGGGSVKFLDEMIESLLTSHPAARGHR